MGCSEWSVSNTDATKASPQLKLSAASHYLGCANFKPRQPCREQTVFVGAYPYTLSLTAVFTYPVTSRLLRILHMNYVALPMLPSDVCFSPPRAANTMQGCSVFVFLDISLFFRFLRNVLDKRGQRSGRCARRRHSHHQRRGQPCARGGKERILHLDCRGSCAALSPPPPTFQSLYLFFSLSVSPFSSPPLTTAPTPPPPAVSTWHPQAVHRQRGSPKCFPIIAFLLSPFSIIYILSFNFLCYFFLAAGVHRQLGQYC